MHQKNVTILQTNLIRINLQAACKYAKEVHKQHGQSMVEKWLDSDS